MDINCDSHISTSHSTSDFFESNTNSTRTLASIQVIEKVEKHINADALELATILGWQIVTRTGEVTPGAKVIYCEIDSMLPVDAPWLPSAIKNRITKEQTIDFFRIKTIKLRGELSQGLIVPIVDTLPNSGEVNSWNELEVGYDVTELLDLQKYEPPAFTGKFAVYGAVSGNTSNFPTKFVNKTDEPRVQSNPKLFASLQWKPYYMTVKLDGTSATYFLDPATGELVVCSRNMIRKKPDNLSSEIHDVINCPYWYIAEKYDIENKLRTVPHLALQGEVCGPNIQRNLLGLKDLELFIFNIVDIRDRSRLSFNDMIATCNEVLSVSHVPIEETGDQFNYETINSLLGKAAGTYKGTKSAREGLVIRATNQSISFKAINNEYLLKYGY